VRTDFPVGEFVHAVAEQPFVVSERRQGTGHAVYLTPGA
jgi:hypothetical protein